MKRKNNAFTLAEVLITLGILGVIATMTLPTLNADVRGKQLAGALRTTQATISDKIQAGMAIEDVNNVRDLKAFAATDLAELYKGLSKYLRLDKVKENHTIYPITGGTAEATWDAADIKQLHTKAYIYISDFTDSAPADGVSGIKAQHGNLLRKNAEVYLDVNGPTKPNRLGYDVFKYYLAQDGRLYPVGGRDVSLFLSGNPSSNDWTATGDTSCSRESGNGYGCAGRVEAEGWNMKYLSTNIKAKVSTSPEGEGGEEGNNGDAGNTPEEQPK